MTIIVDNTELNLKQTERISTPWIAPPFYGSINKTYYECPLCGNPKGFAEVDEDVPGDRDHYKIVCACFKHKTVKDSFGNIIYEEKNEESVPYLDFML